MNRTGVNRNGACVGVERDDWRWARDEEGKLSVSGRHELETPQDFGARGLSRAELGGADGQCGGQLHVERLRDVLLGRGLLGVHHLAHAAGQVAEKSGAHLRVHSFRSGQEACHLVHALIKTSAILAQDRGISREGAHLHALQVPQVLDGHLQDVRLFQFRVSGTIFFECVQDEGLELPQTLVDSGSAAFLHDGFGRLSVLAGVLGFVRGVRSGRRGTGNG